VICKKIKNRVPLQKSFAFVPRGSTFQNLKDQVDSVLFDSVRRTVDICLRETARFEVYKWISYLKNLHTEVAKCPFIDVDSNWAYLIFKDNEDAEVATLKLKNLEIVSHNLSLDNNSDFSTVLYHNVTIAYETEELVIAIEEPEDPMARVLINKETDQEWQTMQTP
jgi:hypothetical protein